MHCWPGCSRRSRTRRFRCGFIGIFQRRRLEAKYASPASRFIHIDGVRIHYRDEGSGPAILLLHANFSNLLGWDPWAEALKDHYRVVRFDFPAFGLTGPDPGGDYSNGARWS